MKNETEVKQHTATPWRHAEGKLFDGSYTGKLGELNGFDKEENAEHIVRCVNVHDELLEACKAFKEYLADCDLKDVTPYEIVEKAINKAEEKG